jgi:peptidoglycan/LPS O-acetylase OafA/YrhL
MKHIRSVDGLRGVAVLAVLVWHLSGLTIFLGARGVDLFFVLSGFCLGLGALERGVNLRAFAWGRVKRIVPPYYAAIVLGVVVASAIGRLSFPHALLEGARNLAFLSERPGLPPVNAAFWTILLEFQWYVFFPLVFILYSRSKLWFAALLAFFVINSQWGLGIIPLADIMPAFMLGIVAADLTLRKTPLPGISWAAIIALIPGIIEEMKRGPKDLTNHAEFLWQVIPFLLILAGTRFWSVLLTCPPLPFFGTISYSLYLASPSALELLAPYRLPPWFAAPVVIGYSYIFYLVFEQRKFTKPYEKRFITWLSLYLFPTPKRKLIDPTTSHVT